MTDILASRPHPEQGYRACGAVGGVPLDTTPSVSPVIPLHPNRGAAYYSALDPRAPDRDGRGLQRQLASAQFADLSFEDRVGMLIDQEWTAREQRRPTACAFPGSADLAVGGRPTTAKRTARLVVVIEGSPGPGRNALLMILTEDAWRALQQQTAPPVRLAG